MDILESTARNLMKNGFQAQVFASAEQAKQAALALIGAGSVGIGGSVTIRDMGLYEALQQNGNPVYWHWKAESVNIPAVHAAAQRADTYLCSSNAVLTQGALLNIDGTGNRVSSLLFGPSRVIVIAGQNKLAASYEEGIARIKREACPPNARRLGHSTPCAITGECNDCNSPQRMCHVTVLLERPSHAVKEVHVFLVRESLGY